MILNAAVPIHHPLLWTGAAKRLKWFKGVGVRPWPLKGLIRRRTTSNMRRVCVQFQPDRAITAELIVYQALRAALPDAEFVEGEDDGRYVTIQFEAASPEEAMSKLRNVFDSPEAGPAARSSCIVTCQGERGWDDYLLLHHYNRSNN